MDTSLYAPRWGLVSPTTYSAEERDTFKKGCPDRDIKLNPVVKLKL